MSEIRMPDEEAKWEEEAAVFRAFLAAEPRFAGRSIKEWGHNQNDAPDIVATTSNGEKVGVELVEWIPERWIHNYAQWSRLLDRLHVPNGWSVFLHIPEALTKPYSAGEKGSISAELAKLLQKHVPAGPGPKLTRGTIKSFPVAVRVLSREAPTLSAYCDLVVFCNFGSRCSIDFEADGLTNDAQNAFRTVIEKKTKKANYEHKRRELKLSRLVLLVHGSGSLTTDLFASHGGIQAAASAVLGRDPGAFDIGFLMSYTNPWLGMDVRCYRIL